MADFGAETETFRAEARGWLEANFSQSLAFGADNAMAGGVARKHTDDDDIWRERMVEKGWGVPTWPRAYGGGELTFFTQGRRAGRGVGADRRLQPHRRHGHHDVRPRRCWNTATRRRRPATWKPVAARGELRWCQGFSEPGAGSDLAGLQTKAEDKGDYWLINGSKIWTSGANLADWCFCLVRTDPSRKHEGISFLLIDMRSPGVETRPIRLISGASPFCETFFTDVRVPKENLVGPLNGGWSIAKRLLQHERSGLAAAAGSARARGQGDPPPTSLNAPCRRRRPKTRIADLRHPTPGDPGGSRWICARSTRPATASPPRPGPTPAPRPPPRS